MSVTIESRLQELGFTLPEAAAPVANYVPYVITGNQLFISGQLPMESGKVAVTGHLGDGVSVEQAARAAQLCAVNILSQAKAALGGDLSKIKRVVKLNGFVSCAPSFSEHHLVINGASNLIADVLGDAGKHARAAVGVPSLPFGAAVEIDAVLEIEA